MVTLAQGIGSDMRCPLSGKAASKCLCKDGMSSDNLPMPKRLDRLILKGFPALEYTLVEEQGSKINDPIPVLRHVLHIYNSEWPF